MHVLGMVLEVHSMRCTVQGQSSNLLNQGWYIRTCSKHLLQNIGFDLALRYDCTYGMSGVGSQVPARRIYHTGAHIAHDTLLS